MRQDSEGLSARTAYPIVVRDTHREPGGVVVHGPRLSPPGRSDIAAAGNSTELPRIELVFRFGQCDNENHGWCEGPPPTVACEVPICWPGLHPPGKVSFRRKKNTAFR